MPTAIAVRNKAESGAACMLKKNDKCRVECDETRAFRLIFGDGFLGDSRRRRLSAQIQPHSDMLD